MWELGRGQLAWEWGIRRQGSIGDEDHGKNTTFWVGVGMLNYEWKTLGVFVKEGHLRMRWCGRGLDQPNVDKQTSKNPDRIVGVVLYLSDGPHHKEKGMECTLLPVNAQLSVEEHGARAAGMAHWAHSEARVGGVEWAIKVAHNPTAIAFAWLPTTGQQG